MNSTRRSPAVSTRPAFAALLAKAATFAAVAVVLAVALPSAASARRHHAHHAHHARHTAHPYVPPYAAIIVDAGSGHVIEASAPDRSCYPASLTKVMTLYLLLDALEQGKLTLHSELPVSAHAAAQAPSKLGLRPGERLGVEDLILALVTKSANDAAVVAGEALGGTEPQFAAMMTRKARELGMRSTTYRNASGLPNSGQVTTPRDQAILARAMIHDHARYYRYFATRDFDFHGQIIANHNRVTLHYPGADGMKTGFIGASGFNLITSAVRDGHRLVGVVFGGRTAAWRDHRMEQLLDTAFARVNGGGVLVAAAAGRVDGILVGGLDRAALRRLHAYEGGEYALRPIRVRTGAGATVPALAFLCRPGVVAGRGDWRLERWQRRHKSSVLRRAALRRWA